MNFNKTISKQLYLILILSFGLLNHGYSQDFWKQLYFPDSSNIFSITIDNQQRIVIGSGNGVYRSFEGDTNWEFLGIKNQIIHSVAINSNGDMYAGCSAAPQFDNGLFRSTDNGIFWEEVLPDIGIYGDVMSILPLGDTIFVSLWDEFGAQLIRSADNTQTWNLVFSTNNHTEYVSDIIKTNSGEMYISLKAYQDSMGGVYKSTNNGDTWQFAGLFNHMVSSLASNNSGDLFAGVWGWSGEAQPGLYVLRNGQNGWDTLICSPQVSDVVVNSDGDIYFTSAWPLGVVRSLDNGQTFELINEGLSSGLKDNIVLDNEGFLYVTSLVTLDKSINTTVSIPETKSNSTNISWKIYPNPVKDVLIIEHNSYTNYSGLIKINIFNITGKQFISKKIQSSNEIIQIDVNILPAGIYIVEVSQNERKSYLKIIKQ